MTDKERLEEIEKNLDPLGYGMGGHLISVNDIYWLVKYAREQAERAQEYDRELISLEDNKHYVSEILEQNKRYKQFIEHFAYCDEDYEGMLHLQNKAKKLIEGENSD